MSNRNPYAVNGYSDSNSSVGRRYGDASIQPAPSTDNYASRAQRQGGWGGFEENPGSLTVESAARRSSERPRYGSTSDEQWQPTSRTIGRQSQESSRSRERRGQLHGTRATSVAYGTQRGEKSMEDVLHYIQNNWKLMAADECVPVHIALQLMDSSSIGLGARDPEFRQTHVDLQAALKSIVNEHHQDFNSSIGTYHKIQASIQSSQSRVRYLKHALADTKGGLLTTKPELKELATSSQQYDDTLQLFSQIESIQSVPEKLEARISEKKFLGAVVLLQEALILVRKAEFDGIGAITDLRTYFTNQEQSLTDILIEELHDHLYLKSPYCQDRWKSKPVNGEKEDAAASLIANTVNSWDKPMYHFLSGLDTTTALTEDTSRSPEADTFYYMQVIIESLNRLGYLDEAVRRIEQRMPVELFKVTERTNNEIDLKYPGYIRGVAIKDKRQSMTMLDVSDNRIAVFSDFLYTLYSKLEAIAEGHRVVHDIISGVVSREKVARPETYTTGFKELWKLYQNEMRTLLHDYLAADGNTASRRTGLTGLQSGNVFSRQQRDRSKRMFKLSEMDAKSAEMKSEQEDVDDILKSSVPGLVSKTRAKPGVVGEANRSPDTAIATQKLLIEPSVFNVGLLLPPSLAFLRQLKDIVPVGSDIAMNTLTSFLDDFLINVFHPQLEEAITELCAKCMIDVEAFAEDPYWARYSPRPIFKGTAAFMALIRSFSTMLMTIPHDQDFTQLIISQLHTYFDKCYSHFKALVYRISPTSNAPSIKTAATFAEGGEIQESAVNLCRSDANANVSEIMAKEVEQLLAAFKAAPLSAYDLISDPKSISSLSLLYNSMQWLSASLALLRHIDPSASKTPGGHSRNFSTSSGPHPRRWTLVTSLKPINGQVSEPAGVADSSSSYLPMTAESVKPFDESLTAFRNLALTSLITLHLDIRCSIILGLDQSLQGMKTGADENTAQQPQPLPRDSASLPTTSSGLYSWVLPAPPAAASSQVLNLNNELIAFDINTSSYLGPKERSYIISGLAILIDRVLVSYADKIIVMNEQGVHRMQLDILVLQQNLRNLAVNSVSASDNALPSETRTSDSMVQLAKSAKYYNLLLAGPEKVLEFAKAKETKGEYSFDELRTLIELCYSAGLRSSDREESVKSKKALQGMLLNLSEACWDQ